MKLSGSVSRACPRLTFLFIRVLGFRVEGLECLEVTHWTGKDLWRGNFAVNCYVWISIKGGPHIKLQIQQA